MVKTNIRPAVQADLDEIEQIYSNARRFMADNGNPTQWVNGYPQRELLEEDIRLGKLYVAQKENELYGVFVFVIGADPTYAYIEDGTELVMDREVRRAAVHGVAKSRTQLSD